MSIDFSYYMLSKSENLSFTPNDACRMAAYFLQNCECYVTGMPLLPGNRELHHIRPRAFSGGDEAVNLVLLHSRAHALVHVENPKKFQAMLNEFPLTREQLQLVNELRYQAHRTPIDLDTLDFPKS